MMTLPSRHTPKPMALRRRKTPAVLATSYVAVLAGAWVTTCVLSSRTVRQSADNSGAVTRDTAVHLDRVAFLIDVLNFIAALAAMPVIYALLARAAVVFSQRTSREKTLGVRQLFALADRKFFGYCGSSKDATVGSTRLAQLGGLLILSAIILPPIRAIFVHTDTKLFPEQTPTSEANGWASTLVGLDPPIEEVKLADRRHIVENTRQAMTTTFPAELKATAWQDPSLGSVREGGFFATALPKDSTTGMYRQHALRMHSTSSCEDIQWSEYPTSCSGDEDQRLEASYDNANLTVKVCVPHMWSNGSPWNETHNRQDLTETMYISVSSPSLTGRTYGGLTMRCMAQTSMGYFELGNSFNGGRFGPLLSSFEHSRKSKGDGEFTDGISTKTHSSYTSEFYDYTKTYDLDYGSGTEHYGKYVAPGPLALTARALFGSGSFFDLAQSITQPNDTVSQTLCHMSPIPFQRVLPGLRPCEPDSTTTGGPLTTGIGRGAKSGGPFASDFGWANDRVYALIRDMRLTSGSVRSLLNTGMYFANQATLQVATTRDAERLWLKYPLHLIVHAEGIPVRTPVVSTVALSVVTVLVGLQVAGIAALVWYIYTMPTWTDTLDALAVAGVTSQLIEREGGFLRSDGFWDTTEKQLKEMNKLDGLVGVVDTTDGEPGDSTPLSTGSDEATMLGDATPALGPGYLLRVGAPGLISRRLQNTRKSLV